MKATEFIRDILDLIDKIDVADERSNINCSVVGTKTQSNSDRAADQVADLVTDLHSNYTTAPNVKYADITAVTTGAGGGVNGPKHPADIKSSTQAMYPGTVHGAR
jgi:hypothetical protein